MTATRIGTKQSAMQHAGMGTMIRSMAWDLGLPVVTYYGLRALGADDTAALLNGTGVAGVRLAWVAARERRVSAFSMLMGAVFGVGLIFTLVTGDPRFMLVKHSAMAAACTNDPHVRHGHRVASLVWGGGLLAEALVRIVLVYSLPIDVMVGLSTALTVVTFAALIGWTGRYVAGHARTEAALV
jgi:hypothetical protein